MQRSFLFRWIYRFLPVVVLSASTVLLKAQTPAESADPLFVTQLENITESLGDAQPEDDQNAQALEQYLRTPINLNAADEAALSDFF